MKKAMEIRLISFLNHEDRKQLLHLVYVDSGRGDQIVRDFREQHPGFVEIATERLNSVLIEGTIKRKAPIQAQRQ